MVRNQRNLLCFGYILAGVRAYDPPEHRDVHIYTANRHPEHRHVHIYTTRRHPEHRHFPGLVAGLLAMRNMEYLHIYTGNRNPVH